MKNLYTLLYLKPTKTINSVEGFAVVNYQMSIVNCLKSALLILNLLILNCFSAHAQTEQTWNIGTPNANSITATLTDYGALIISGSGAMLNYNTPAEQPWVDYRNDITALSIGNNITTIGSNAFSDFNGITTITLPASITTINNDAFSNCSSLTTITSLRTTAPTLTENVFLTGCPPTPHCMFRQALTQTTKPMPNGTFLILWNYCTLEQIEILDGQSDQMVR